MKDTITHIAEWVLIVILALLCIFTAYKAYTVKNNVEYITNTDTLVITDTITNWVPHTVTKYRTDTAYLQIIEQKLDTVTDSIFVAVPIYDYTFDTLIKHQDYETRLKCNVSGYNVEFNELTENTTIYPREAKTKKENRFGLGVGIGIGYKDGGITVGPTIGLMYKL